MKDMIEQSPDGGVAEQARDMLNSMLSWKEHIEAAMAHADWSHTFDDITLMTIKGQLTFFDFGDCFCFAQINVFPQFKVFHFMIAGGDLQAMIDNTPMFKELAAKHGCAYLSFSGRRGFEPFLRASGWKHKFTTMWLGVDE